MVLVIVGLGFIIFIHELGHFLMAKKNKVKVEIFSLGFGPAIWKFRRGETEYRISWFPLGGYVKMAGETLVDERRGEPWELTSKTPWQRFQIFVAGATMNLLIAFPIGVLAYVVGKYEHTNEVGIPGVAESRADLRPGDIVTNVDGRRIDSLDKFRIEMIRRPTGTVVPVTALRDGKEIHLQVKTMKSPYHQSQTPNLMMDQVTEGSPLAKQGIREGDELIEVDGKPVIERRTAEALLKANPGHELTLKFRRREPNFQDGQILTATVTLPPAEYYVIPQEDSILEARVGQLVGGRPAFDVLELGDLITRISGKDIGDRPIRCWQDLKEAVEPSANKPLEFEVVREKKGEEKSEILKVTIAPAFNELSKGSIGVGPKATSTFARVNPGGFYDRAGVKTGDVLYTIGGVPGDVTLMGIRESPGIFRHEKKPVTVELKVRRQGLAEPLPISLTGEKVLEGDLAQAGFKTEGGALVTWDAYPFRKRPLGDAVREGLSEPYDLAVMTFDVLRKLVTREESTKGLSGPIGIIHASYNFAKKSFGNFLWLLCLITVNLGIFNLLPIPVLDGGHNVLLLIEVIRKKLGKPPPSEKFVAGFQYAGLFFILALFLFVTFNDLHRMI
jgi:regulator of sigma E protease